ncbi:MAG: 16S rRNA (guanine(527)-N(7))-methyltransferase RsmG [Clostridiales bacterium]|nr:16S rRNA (guanine(527)-N(7))-methyltransferase RsmG [Clostridiales bacterium]
MQKQDVLKNYLSQIGIELQDEKIALLLAFCDTVLETNKKFNLTAITDYDEFLIKHVTDSLLGLSEIPSGAKLCDVGAGAGFPSMPIAIARDDVRVTALDSTAKKMTFIADSARTLGVNNVKTIAGRAEEQRSLFGTFDIVTARAVSALPILLELCIPLLKVGGRFLAYKATDSELDECKTALKVLNAQFVHAKSAQLPNGDSRTILVFEKTAKTDGKYPRQYGTIKKKPL